MRLPTLERDFWILRSGEDSHSAHPDKFWIPPAEEHRNLQRGKAAQLIFDIEAQDEDGEVVVSGERMWVIVAERVGEKRVRPKRTPEWESISPLRLEKPILWTGTHPEIAVRFWSDLPASLPPGVECRWIVLGVPALVHPETGVLFGIAFDTKYALRLTDADMESALKGEASADGWSDGKKPKLASEIGPDWVFGRWQIAELA